MAGPRHDSRAWRHDQLHGHHCHQRAAAVLSSQIRAIVWYIRPAGVLTLTLRQQLSARLENLKRFARSIFVSLGVFLGVHLLGADVVIQANTLLLLAIRNEDTGAPLAARNLAILHTAIYDAFN